MKRNEKILKTLLFTLSSILIMRNESLNVKASNDTKVKENKYRYEHQIEEDVELIDLSNKDLIKTEYDGKTKYYICSREQTYIDEKVNQENIKKLFKDTPPENYLNSNKPKYVKKPIIDITEYTDLTNEENKFTICRESVNVYNGFPSNENSELIFWGDINTYSQTITNETYIEYYSFDVSTQKISRHYDNEPEVFISICSKELLKEIYQDDYITREDLVYVVDLLNGDVPIYTKAIH